MASWYDSEIQMLGKLAEIKETPANIQYFIHRHTWSGIRQMAKKHNADIQLCSNLKVVDDIYNYFINLPENKKALSSFVVDLNRANGLDSVEQIGRILIKEKDRKYFIEKIEAPTRHYNYTKEYVDYDTALEILRRIRDEEVIPLQFAWYYRNYKYQTSEFMRNNLVAEGRKKALKTIVELCRY